MTKTRHEGAARFDITFHGVRGSYPVPGEATGIYGGNTCCVSVRLDDRLIILDAGTGIVPLGHALQQEPPAEVDILLSHLHQDHIQGLFFFKPLFSERTRLRLWCGNLGGQSPEAPLRAAFSPPLFPLSFDNAKARVSFHGFRAGETIDLGGGIAVDTCLLNHPSGATAYRFAHRGRAFVHVTDNEHAGPEPDAALLRLCQAADLVVYDAMFTQEEYPAHRGWGHSTPAEGLKLLARANAHRLACFHHNPRVADGELAAREAALQALSPESFFAREGTTLNLLAADDARPPTAAGRGIKVNLR